MKNQIKSAAAKITATRGNKMDTTIYAHISTGDTDTKEDWIAAIENSDNGDLTAEEEITRCIDAGILIPVEADDDTISKAREFRNRFDDLGLLAAALNEADEESGDVNVNQDWDNGTTTWTFSDNSEIVIDDYEAIVRQHFGETELTDALNASTTLSGLKTVLENAEDKMNSHDMALVLDDIDVIDLGTIDGPELDDIYEGSLIAHDDCFALTAEAGRKFVISARAESMPWLIGQVVELAGNQVAAAELLGVEQASISNYINGKSEPIKSVIFLAQRILAD